MAFGRIDMNLAEAAKAPTGAASKFKIDDATWKEVLTKREPVARVEDIDGVPHLTVLRPMANGPTCQVCHGPVTVGATTSFYGPANDDPENRTRAVLVVRRSQAAVEEQIAANTRDTLLVGGGTTLGLLAVLFLASRVFGIRLRPQRYG